METNREIWRSVDGFANYEVSTHGRVRNAHTERILKPQIQTAGYLQVCLSRNTVQKRYLVHRLVAQEFIDNPDELPFIDHIDGDTKNNHVSNLRYASGTQNQGNRRKHASASSTFKGVTWDSARSKWKARIVIDSKLNHLGYYDDEEEAARAYDRVAREHFGEFALLNF